MSSNHEDLTRLSDVIGLIYEGATDPGRWTQDILPVVTQYIQAPACALFTPFQMPQDGGFVFIHGMSQEQMDLYVTRYQAEDIQSQTAAAKGLIFEGSVIVDTDIMPREQLLESKYYKEYLSRENMAQLLTSVVFGPDSASLVPVVGCSFFRGLTDTLFGEPDRERLRLILPHISRSLGVMQRIRSAELTVATTLSALDRLPSGVLLLDHAGTVAFANKAAGFMLEEGDGLRLKNLTNMPGLGELVAESATASNAIREAISSTIKRDPFATPHFSRCVTVPHTSGTASYTLQFSALGEHNEFGSFAGIVFIADGAREVEIDPEVLKSAYGLTPTEARVAIALVECATIQEVADKLEVGVATARSHVKQIYAKLGVDTRARFVKLMLGLAVRT